MTRLVSHVRMTPWRCMQVSLSEAYPAGTIRCQGRRRETSWIISCSSSGNAYRRFTTIATLAWRLPWRWRRRFRLRLALRPITSRVEPEAAQFTQIAAETTRTGPHESCRKLEHVPTPSAHVHVYRGQNRYSTAIFSVPYGRIFFVGAWKLLISQDGDRTF